MTKTIIELGYCKILCLSVNPVFLYMCLLMLRSIILCHSERQDGIYGTYVQNTCTLSNAQRNQATVCRT